MSHDRQMTLPGGRYDEIVASTWGDPAGSVVGVRGRFSRRTYGYPARVPLPSAPLRLLRRKARASPRIVLAQGLAAGSRQMAGDLRIHAHIVERACRDRGDDRPGMGTALGGRAVITTLTGRYNPDDQPYQHDETSDSHVYLRKTRTSCCWKEPRTRVVLSSTPAAAVIRLEGGQYAVHGRNS
jgi:hypothetical protein